MRTETPHAVRLEDYRPSDFLIDRIDLDIRLHPTETRVTATLAVRPNPQGPAGAALELDGDELRLVALALDGRALAPADYDRTYLYVGVGRRFTFARGGGLYMLRRSLPLHSSVTPRKSDYTPPAPSTSIVVAAGRRALSHSRATPLFEDLHVGWPESEITAPTLGPMRLWHGLCKSVGVGGIHGDEGRAARPQARIRA